MNNCASIGLRTAACAALMLLAIGAHAGDLTVTHAWARPTVPGQVVGAAYFDVRSAHGATLTRISSDAANAVQMHSMTREGDIMRMRELPSLALPAGTTVHLGPGGTHLMLVNLKRPLKAGESVPLELTFTDAQGRRELLRVNVPVTATPPQETSR